MPFRPALLILALLLGCATAERPAASHPTAPLADPIAPLIGTTWVADLSDPGATLRVQATLEIEQADRVSGSGGCNTYNGAVRLVAGTVLFGPIATSRRACPPAVMQQETRFFDALVNARGLELDGTMLYFLDATGSRTLGLTRAAPAP